jgi:hypothetical protein
MNDRTAFANILGRATLGAATALALVVATSAQAQQVERDRQQYDDMQQQTQPDQSQTYESQTYEHAPENTDRMTQPHPVDQSVDPNRASDRAGAAQTQTGVDSRAKGHSMQPMMDSGEAGAIVVGKVIETRDIELADADAIRANHRLIKIESDKGRTAIVDIGVANLYPQVNFDRGDRIIAVGKQARINDRPVIFAKSVGELYSVGAHSGNGATPGAQNRSSAAPNAAMDSSNAATAATTRPENEIVYFFETDNLSSDDYGAYDEDFAWTTDAPWYMDWNEADSAWSNDYERPHYDMFGYDDAGEWGIWDW